MAYSEHPIHSDKPSAACSTTSNANSNSNSNSNSNTGQQQTLWFSRDEKRLFRSTQICDTRLVEAIKQRLKNNPGAPRSMETLAAEMCLSPRTLSRRLQAINCHYRDLKSEVMVELAQDYLRSTSAPINSVARQLGYNDPSNFCKAFKLRTGTTPRRYRQQYLTQAPAIAAA